MKPTEKAGLWALLAGLVVGFGSAWLLPGAVWWVYFVVGLIFATGFYTAGVKHTAAERIANGELDPSSK